MKQQLNIGLFGFGTVGTGLYEVLKQTPGLQAQISCICIKNPGRQRIIPQGNFTADPLRILNDENINVVVELIDDADAAFEIVKAALQKGKAVVSANKKMIATHFSELLLLQQQYKVPFLYEAACCASIPVIRNLEEYYDNDLLHSFRGIINGSTNYILSKMCTASLTFADALLEAQQRGFAESNPSLDVRGYDAANKLVILLAHAFGLQVSTSDFVFNGITGITEADSRLAQERGWRIKLVAQANKLQNGGLAAFVLPQFVTAADELFHVQDEFNAVVTESSFADRHFLKGKGAGAFPTASAVLSDISALRYRYRYEYRKLNAANVPALSDDYYLDVFVSADHANKIRQEDFEWTSESFRQSGYARVRGVIAFKKLAASDWWKEDDISLIVSPGAIAQDVAYRKISARSLRLAGVTA